MSDVTTTDPTTDGGDFLVLAAREADVPVGSVIPPGIRTSRCDRCGCRVLVSPSSGEAIAAGAGVVCGPCYDVRPAPPVNVVAVTTEAVAEYETLRNPERN
jgi:hypothetical protein